MDGDAIYEALESENIELFKELWRPDTWENFDFFACLEDVVATCNIELMQAVLETYPYVGPINLRGFDAFLHISDSARTKDETKILKMVQFILPYLGCSLVMDYFPGLVSLCAIESFLVTEFLIHKLYSENNSLFPLIKKLEAAVEKSHYICIFLHDDICIDEKLMDCFYYVHDEFQRFPYYSFTHFGICVKVLTKLLAKDTPESMQLAVETFHVLLDKNLFLLARNWTSHIYYNQDDDCVITNENLLLLIFQFVYNSMNFKTQEKIYAIISEWFTNIRPTEDIKYEKLLDQSKEFLRPFLSKPLDHLWYWTFGPLDPRSCPIQAPNDDGKVPSLKEVCRDVIRSKIFEQTNDVKEFMQRIWALQLPLTVKCFLLYVPEASWMNNLQMS